MDNQKLTSLANKFINGTATDEEKEQLNGWYNDWQDDEEQIAEGVESTRLRILSKINEKLGIITPQEVPVVSIKRYRWKRFAAVLFFAMLLFLSRLLR